MLCHGCNMNLRRGEKKSSFVPVHSFVSKWNVHFVLPAGSVELWPSPFFFFCVWTGRRAMCTCILWTTWGIFALSLLPHLKRREFVLLHSCITCHLVCCLRACCRWNNVTPSCRCVDWCVFSSMLLRLPYSFSHFPPPQSGRYESRGWGIIPSLHKNGPADPYVRHKLPQEVANEVSHIKVRIGNRWLNTDECKQLCAVPFFYPVSTLWLCSSLWPDLVSVVSTAI